MCSPPSQVRKLNASIGVLWTECKIRTTRRLSENLCRILSITCCFPTKMSERTQAANNHLYLYHPQHLNGIVQSHVLFWLPVIIPQLFNDNITSAAKAPLPYISTN